jgi:hypothetical protein
MRVPSWVLVLAAGAAAYGQPQLTPEQIRSAGIRCNQLNQAIQAIQASRGAVPADFQTGREACKLSPGRDLQQAQQKMAQASATLDRLKLTPEAVFDVTAQAAAGLAGKPRFYVLAPLAKSACELGKWEKARQYARELLQLASDYPDDWNYGNAIYYGYFVLGRVAVEEGNLALAGQYLRNASTTPGSPQLNNFGPNMTLARELLEHRQFSVVADFLEQCKSFWKMDQGRLEQWAALVRRGEIPDFRANLDY